MASGPSALAFLRRFVSRAAEPYVLFPVMAVVLLGVVWGTTVSLIRVERAAARNAAASSAVELADTYEAQVVRALREIDQALKVVQFAHDRGGGRADLDELRRKGLLPPELLFAVRVADENGAIVASTRSGERGSVAQVFLEERGADRVVVGRPRPGPDGEPRLDFSRRLRKADGRFDGAVVISVSAAYFVSGYEVARLGRRGVLGILGNDGVFRARRTGDAVHVGETTDYALATAGAAAGPAATVALNPWDAVRRYTSARELFDFPLAVVVGLAEDEQLAAVQERAAQYLWRAAAASIALVLLLGGLGYLSWRLMRTRLDAHRALQDEVAVRRRAEAALNLRNRAIESSVNAIVITNLGKPGHPIEYVNPAFERITGYAAADTVGRGMEFLLGAEQGQPGMREIELALRERREAHAVLRSYRRDGRLFWNEFHAAPVRDDHGNTTHFVAVMNDVTEAKRYEEQLAHQANFDPLTGLANRNLLHDRLTQALAAARRDGGTVATVFLDLDHFKMVNDSLGHTAGDELLRAVAQRLRACVREVDTVARLGGDEFVLVLHNRPEDRDSLDGDALALMDKLLGRLPLPVVVGDQELRATASIGVSLFPQDGPDAETLLRNADAAMYRAKELGRNRFQFFTADVHERIRRRMELEATLRQALERDEFELHYQPQVNVRDGTIVGVEALLRWRHPTRGLVGPGHFIGFAEETGLIVPIGAWVLERACRQNKAWQEAGLPPIPVAVNMSARQCEQDDVAEVVRHALQASGLDPRYLELEITESLSMANPGESVPLMHRLKATGVSLSIDDFGTGFSSLSYLRQFPVDRLKIDLSFVREITTDPGSLAISEAIITMSHSLNLEVIAEGVETLGQLELLGARDCDLVQGFLFSPPLAAEAFERLVREGRRLPAVGTARTTPARVAAM